MDDPEGFAAGQTVKIGSGDTEETCQITDVSDSTISLDCILAYDHAAGEGVCALAEEVTPTPPEYCPPVFPGTYNGSVRLDGVPAPDGMIVTASLDGQEWGSGSVIGGLYVVDIPQSLPAEPPCFPGGTITFTLNGNACEPSPEWASGLHDLDLDCAAVIAPTATPEVTVTPEPTATATPVAPPPTGGGGLLPGGVSVPWLATIVVGGLLALAASSLGLLRAARSRLG